MWFDYVHTQAPSKHLGAKKKKKMSHCPPEMVLRPSQLPSAVHSHRHVDYVFIMCFFIVPFGVGFWFTGTVFSLTRFNAALQFQMRHTISTTAVRLHSSVVRSVPQRCNIGPMCSETHGLQ